jgi:bacillithiol biosynthesis deacetylase BshB1
MLMMRILFTGIHPDDIELGCGGTVALCVDQGHDVTLADLTRGESSSNGTPEEREAEAIAATEILGCRQRHNLGLPDTGIHSEDDDQLRAVSNLIREVRPDVLVFPNGDDPHPDHACGAALIRRAAYLAGIHGYEGTASAWKVRTLLECSGRKEVPHHIIVDTSSSFARKRDAILAHRTQFDRGSNSAATPLNDPDFLSAIEARDRACGQRIGARYGEAFRTLAPVALRALDIFAPEGGA